MRVGDVCKTNMIFCTPETTIVEAAKLMHERGLTEIVVEDNRAHAVAVLTDHDVADAVALDVDMHNLLVKDVVNWTKVHVDAAQGVHETFLLMRTKGLPRVPVVNAANKIIGIARLNDLMQFIAPEMRFADDLTHRNDAAPHTVAKV
jgi:CBS domain-containing protein